MSSAWNTDYLWREIQGAKLASLFGLDQEASQGNESFQFTAPKQPKKAASALGPPPQKPAPPPPTAPAVLLATAVQAFRFVNGQYVKQGRVGAAILGDHDTREYKILLYGSQQKQITTAKIHLGFTFTVQPGNYGSFYDDQRQNWSLMFDSQKAEVDFCKEVCVARRNSDPSVETVVFQELLQGEGGTVECGDTVLLAFSAWLLQNQHIGQMFDSNIGKDKLLRVTLGAGKVIKGLEEGLLGMQRGGRRLLIMPPSLGYGSKGMADHVPPSSTLIYEVEIHRVKFSKDTTSSYHLSGGSAANPCRDALGPEVAPKPQPQPSILTEPGSQPLRVKSNSINEQPKRPDAAKANLISRMAKMGQPTLPFLTGAIPAQPDLSDSETEDPSESHHSNPPSPSSPQAVQMSTTPHVDTAPPQPSPVVTTSTASLQPAVTMETSAPQATGNSSHGYQPYPHFQCLVSPCHLQPIGQYVPPHPITHQAPNDVTSFLMTEARQHTTEIHLAIGRVADKVELLVDKVEELQKQGSGPPLGLASMTMETAMVMHNIQRIIQENVYLKKELLEKSSRLEEQTWKMGELMEQNQRHMEQSSLLLEQQSEVLKRSSQQSQNHLLQAEQDKVHLAEKLASSSSVVCELQQQNSSLQQRVSELQSQLSAALQDVQTHCTHNSTLENQMEELKAGEERAQAQCRMEKRKWRESELRLTAIDEELNDLRAQNNTLKQMLSDRKRKWQQEHQRLAEELEECQAELCAEWQMKVDRAVCWAEEEQSMQVTELSTQRDTLERATAWLHQQYAETQKSAEIKKQKLQTRLADQKRRLAQLSNQNAMEDQLKRVMNGLFHSLRGEFDQHQSYQGAFILGVILKTIKKVTLALLAANKREQEEEEDDYSDEEEEGEEEEETLALGQNGTTQGENCEEDEDCAKKGERKDSGILLASRDQTVEEVMESEVQEQEQCAHSSDSEGKTAATVGASGDPATETRPGVVSNLSQPLTIQTEEGSAQSQTLTVQSDQPKQTMVIPLQSHC